MSETAGRTVWVSCRVCGYATTHTIRSDFAKTATPGDYELRAENGNPLLLAWTAAQILECQVCGALCFRQGWTSAPDRQSSWRWTMYPAPEERRPFAASRLFPAPVEKLYRETIQAFNREALTLATAGMRAIVEAVCIERHCKGADLEQKIRKLNGILSASDANLLQTHRAMGNEAIHNMQTPSPAEAAEALDILEHVLKTLYELPHQADNLRRMRRARIQPDRDVEPQVS